MKKRVGKLFLVLSLAGLFFLPHLAFADFCGDNVKEPSEVCDGTDTPPNTVCSSNCQMFSGQFPGGCGDGKINGTEECDDGNLKDGDGCDGKCKKECGNGVVEGHEMCDDGNSNNNDSCNDFCIYQPSPTTDMVCYNNKVKHVCYLVVKSECLKTQDSKICAQHFNACVVQAENDCMTLSNPYLPNAKCGNGKLDANEACDDGNKNDGDGCSSLCKKEDSSSSQNQGEPPPAQTPAPIIQLPNLSPNQQAQVESHIKAYCYNTATGGTDCDTAKNDCTFDYGNCLFQVVINQGQSIDQAFPICDKAAKPVYMQQTIQTLCTIPAGALLITDQLSSDQDSKRFSLDCSFAPQMSETRSMGHALFFLMGLIPLIAQRMRRK